MAKFKPIRKRITVGDVTVRAERNKLSSEIRYDIRLPPYVRRDQIVALISALQAADAWFGDLIRAEMDAAEGSAK